MGRPIRALLAGAFATLVLAAPAAAETVVVPVISVSNATVAPEGDSGIKPATFTVSLSAPTTVTVRVGFATAGVTATAPDDFVTSPGIVTFTPGQTSQIATVDVKGDTLVEGDETFRVQLFSPVAGTLGTAQGIGTIVDDDRPPVVKPPGGIKGDGVFCGARHRGTCRGLRFTAQFRDAPGNAAWTFDAYNPSPGRTRAHSAAITSVRVGSLERAVTSKASVRVTFRVKGKKADSILRTIRRRKLTRLRITTIFVNSAGQWTETVSVVKLT